MMESHKSLANFWRSNSVYFGCTKLFWYLWCSTGYTANINQKNQGFRAILNEIEWNLLKESVFRGKSIWVSENRKNWIVSEVSQEYGENGKIRGKFVLN